MGGVLKSLPFRRPLARQRRRCFQLERHVEPVARKDGGVGQQARQAPGRQVWFNFRETKLTHQRSYLARLNYVHQNAVKHGLVPVACQYPWCSAAWFEHTASAAMVKSIYRFKTDRIQVADEFEVSADW